jgi:hypothetical protein
MAQIEEKPASKGFGPLDLVRDEIEKIKKNIPKTYDDIAKFLAISRPIVEVVFMNCGDWTDQVKPQGPGKRPFSRVSLMLIHILVKMIDASYRDVERVLRAHPAWLKALKLKKAPSHARLSTFRTEMGDSFFKNFFYELTALLSKLGLIKGEGTIADSAPILASMNFARANAMPKINVERVKEFFASVDVFPAIKALNITRKGTYDPAAMIRFLTFEKLGGFLSRAQAIKFVKNDPEVAKSIGFVGGAVPSQPTFNYFAKVHGSIPTLLKPLVESVTEFFDACKATPNESDIDFFFWSV